MINLDSRRAANDVPDIPHTTLSRNELAEIAGLNDQRRLIATLTHQRDEAQREMAVFRKRCSDQINLIGKLLGKLAAPGMDASAVWADLAARADEEGAFHRDDVLAILRKHGAV